jgi:hypothetical protein
MLSLTNLQKRMLYFLIGCIGTRLFFVYLAKTFNETKLKIMGIFALIIGFGFLIIYLFGLRESGPETMGDKIWWNDIRPFHALTYLTFAYLAIIGDTVNAWKVLLLDVIVGLGVFLIHHSKVSIK